MFQPLENIRPFLKMAFEGFAGDGKTFTATQVAIGLHKAIGSKKPIAILDTEAASKALLPLFRSEGVQAVVSEGRSLTNVNQAIKWCEEGNADILIIDSISHIWESFLEAYQNSKRYAGRLTFQDWGILKPRWKAEFSTPFVKAKIHIIFTGRAGYEYDIVETIDNRTGRKQQDIQKSGIKMKAEGETAYEPDLLVLMEKKQQLLEENKAIFRQATIVKDRTNTIDGTTIKNPTYKDFEPAIKLLLDGISKEYTAEVPADLFNHNEGDYAESRKERDIAVNEIEGCFALMELGTGKEEKAYKAAILFKVFNCKTTEALQQVTLEALKAGKEIVDAIAADYCKLLADWKAEGQKPDLLRIKDIVEQHATTPF